MKITALICTHNRVDLLRRTLDSIRSARLPEFCDFNLMVVANACTDNTMEMVNGFRADFNVLCIEESAPGKSNALNRGIQAVDQGVICLIDDDQRLSEDYFSEVISAFERYPVSSLLCGRLIPDWTGNEPAWLHAEGKYRIFPPPIPAFDLGDEPVAIDSTHELPPGGTLIADKEVFSQVGEFSTTMGPKGHDLVGGEDSEFLLRFFHMGGIVQYVPAIVQYHYVDPERLKLRYLMKKSFQRTRSFILTKHPHPEGIPLYLWRKLGTYLIHVIFSLSLQKSRYYLMRVSSTLGEISGFRGHDKQTS